MGHCSTEFWCSPSLLLVLGCEPTEVAIMTGGEAMIAGRTMPKAVVCSMD